VRVLYFTRDYTPHDHRFLTALAKTGHQVYSLRLERQSNQLEDRALPPEIQQIVWLGGRKPFQWKDAFTLRRDLKRVIREIRPDVIHAGPIQHAAFLTALAGYHPLVSMSWGSDLLRDAERNSWWRWVTKFTLKRTDVLVGDCEAVKNKAVVGGFPKERVVLFPWGVDLDTFVPQGNAELRKRLGWDDAFLLLSLRSWEPLYGVDMLVKAFVKAAREIPELRLVLLGNGSQAGIIRSIIHNNQMDDRVFFGGRVSNKDLPEFYRAADLYISASHSDGSSVSLMEALGCGCPVLLSDIPGNLEWITPGKQGWFFRDGDVDALCAGILTAYKEKKRLVEMQKACRTLAEERADWNKNFLKLETAYQMAVGSHSGKY